MQDGEEPKTNGHLHQSHKSRISTCEIPNQTMQMLSKFQIHLIISINGLAIFYSSCIDIIKYAAFFLHSSISNIKKIAIYATNGRAFWDLLKYETM